MNWNLDVEALYFTVANENDSNNTIFTIKYTKLYIHVVTLSVKDNQKLSKLLSKGLEGSGYWNEYKAKSRIKIQEMSTDILLNQTLSEFWFIQTKMVVLKDLIAKCIIY